MCRGDIVTCDSVERGEPDPENFIINPQTKRRVKIGGKTYNYLKKSKII
jgi:hypothetical protein